MTDGQHNRTMKGATTTMSEGMSNGNGGRPRYVFFISFFFFSNDYLQYNAYDYYYIAWQNYIRPKQQQMLFCTQVFLFFVFIHVFSQLNNIFIFSSERRSTKASIGQRGPTKLDESQRGPMKVNTGQQEFMKVSKGRLEQLRWTLCKTFFTFL